MRVEKTVLLLVISMAFMVFALLIGIFRLMTMNSLNTGILARLYGFHSIIMIFGFLAAIIMLERVAGVALIPGAKGMKVPILMVPFVILGVVTETLGYVWNIDVLTYSGAIFLVAGCLAFAHTLAFLKRNSEAKLSYNFMMLSVASLAMAAIASAFTLPEDNLGFIMLLISFPILFILGERIELTRAISTTKDMSRFKQAFVMAAASIILFVINSAEPFSTIINPIFFIGSLLLLVVFIYVLVVESKNLKLLAKSARPLQRYISLHVRIAYVWGIFGMILAAAYSASGLGLELYDPFIHSLAIGFVGTMMLAHGPTILPGVIGRSFDEKKLSMLPLGVLTLAVALRVFGQLLLLISYAGTLRIIVGLSGWFVFIAVILFLRSVLNGTRTSSTGSDPRDYTLLEGNRLLAAERPSAFSKIEAPQGGEGKEDPSLMG